MNVLELFAKLSLDSKDYEKGLDKAKSNADSVGSKIGNGLKTAAKIGAAALATATTAATGFAVSAVKAGQDFDSSMSQVAATMGKSVDEIKELRDFAQEMGATTAFSATQAADALNYMALAGYDADTSMSMLPTVLDLAAAGNIDLAAASDMVTDAQSALGLSLEETSEMVDKMAKASSKSNTSVAQLGEAFLTIGATARNLKGGTTELSTVLGVLADNGIKGAEGGTHLRNILLSLQTPTKDGIAALAELGLTYEDMYDEAGNMRGLDEIMLDLQKRMEGMTQASKDAITSGIFNKTDLAAVNALIGTSSDRYAELTKEIDNSNGAAENMAKTQLDNLAGDITLLKSAFEGLQIAISDKLTPSLREFTQFGANALSKLTTAFKEGGLSGAMGAFGEILTDGLNMVIDMAPKLLDAGAKLLEALAKGLLESVPKLASTALTIIQDLAKYLIEAIPELMDGVFEVIISLSEMLTDPDTLTNIIDAALKIILALVDGLMRALPKLMENGPKITMNLIKAIIQSAPLLLDAAVELIAMLVRGIVEGSVALVDGAGEVIGNFLAGIGEGFVKMFEIGKEMIDEIKKGIAQKIEDAKNWGKDLIKNFMDGIKGGWNGLKDTVSNVAGGIKNLIGFSEPDEGPLSNFHTYAPDMMKLFAQGIKDNENLVTNQLKKSFDFDDIVGENINVSASGEKTVRHTGTIRLEGVNNEGEFVAASEYAIEDIVVNIMKRQARLA